MTNIEQKVRKYISDKHLLTEGQSVLVALSGGADSVCLMLVLLKLGYKCQAVHCNFHLRGDESNRDERFVTELCSRLRVPLYKMDFDTLTYAQKQQVSIEMSARELRYAYFAQLMQKHDIPTLAVGHHQNDNAETLLLNLTRGTGIRGLSGIQPKRDSVVRPLLCLTHQEVTSYLASLDQSWVEDSTNSHDDVARNIIRLNVLPELERINPSALQNIISTIENLQEVQKVYTKAVYYDIARCTVSAGVLSVPRLKECVSPSSVIHEWLNGWGYNHTQEQDILQAAFQGQSGRLIKNVLVDRDTLILEDLQTFMTTDDITFQILPREEVTITADPNIAYLDTDKFKGKVKLRLVQSSDYFQPFGMHGKRKLLSDFLTDCKLNLFQKRHQLVLCDSQNIAWVVGLRSSELFRVDEHTKDVTIVTYKNK